MSPAEIEFRIDLSIDIITGGPKPKILPAISPVNDANAIFRKEEFTATVFIFAGKNVSTSVMYF